MSEESEFQKELANFYEELQARQKQMDPVAAKALYENLAYLYSYSDERQGGRTSLQMCMAPACAVYIWCNFHLYYPKDLAKHLGRTDLQIVDPHWLESFEWRGRWFSGVILDHAAQLTGRQGMWFEAALSRVEK